MKAKSVFKMPRRRIMFRDNEHVVPDEYTRKDNGGTSSVVWLTGLSGAGKSTIASYLERLLVANTRRCLVLDGDVVRKGLSRDLGYNDADRKENMRRIAEVASLLVNANINVIVSMISPFRAERQTARDIIGSHRYIEVYVETPIAECVRRDPKGHYQRASTGELPDFTGITSPYEPPLNPDIHIKTLAKSPDAAAREIYGRMNFDSNELELQEVTRFNVECSASGTFSKSISSASSFASQSTLGGVEIGFKVHFGSPQDVPGLGRLAPNMSVLIGWAGVPISGVTVKDACFGNVTDVCQSAKRRANMKD